MLKKQRQELITNYLNEHRFARVDTLAKAANSTEITTRRDINELHELGLLKKVYGGAQALDLITQDVSFTSRIDENLSVKKAIAKKASEYIKNGMRIYLDAGSSTSCLIPFLKDFDVQVFTHGVHHVNELSKYGVKTHLIGGDLKLDTLATVGASTIIYLEQFRFDIAFMGTNAIDMHQGFMTPDVTEAMVKRRIIELSEETYILADYSKFNRASNVVFAGKDIPIITNRKVSKDYIDFDIRVI